MDDAVLVAADDISRLLNQLKNYTSTPGNGVTRLPFSKEGREAADFLLSEMHEIGLDCEIDLVGNVRGVLKATSCDPGTADTIIMGSHYDTVKSGGEYDGIAGVVCALEVAKLLRRTVPVRDFNFTVYAFNDEEGCMFGSGCLGSKSLTGQVNEEYITHLSDENGITIKEHIESWGKDPARLKEQVIDLKKVRAFLEIHIEQGPVLDMSGEELGVVSGIVGLLRCMATVTGRADHAGTTPMDMRKDSLSIASKVISQLDTLAEKEGNGSVATCGFIRAYPNAMNVVAGRTEFTMDLRSIEDRSVKNMEKEVRGLLDKYSKAAGATYDIDVKLRQPAVRMDEELVRELAAACKKNGYSYRTMTSGAAHDAMIFADKVPTAMVFVPSKDGRSHCPQEFSRYEDLAKAVQITFECIKNMMVKIQD